MAANTTTISARLALDASSWNTEFQETLSKSSAVARQAGQDIAKQLGDGANSNPPNLSPLVEHFRNQGEKAGEAFSENAVDKLKDFSSEIPGIGSALGALTGPLALAAGAIAGIGLAIGETLMAYDKWNIATARLGAILNSTGNQTGYTKDQLVDFAEELSKRWAVNKEDVVSAEGRLASYQGIAGSTFKGALEAAGDYAAFMKTDVTSATEIIGRTMQNLSEGSMDGLKKGFKDFGPVFIAHIADLIKVGDNYGAMQALMEGVHSRSEGLADITGGGLAGAFFRLKEGIEGASFEIIKQTGLYDGAVSGMNKLADKANDVATAFKGMSAAHATEITLMTGAALALNPTGTMNSLVRGSLAPSAATPGNQQVGLKTSISEFVREDTSAENAQAKSKAAADAEAKKTQDAKDAAEAAKQAERDAAAQQSQRERDAQSAADQALRDAENARKAAQKITDQYDKSLASLQEQAVELKDIGDGNKDAAKLAKDIFDYTEKNKGLDADDLATLIAKVTANDALAVSNEKILEAKKAQAEADKKSLEEAQKAAKKVQEDIDKQAKLSLDSLSSLFDDAFGGKGKSFWTSFEDIGKKTISRLMAQFILTGKVDLGSALDASGGGGLVSLLGLGVNKTPQIISGASGGIAAGSYLDSSGNFSLASGTNSGIADGSFLNSAGGFSLPTTGVSQGMQSTAATGFSFSGLASGLKSALPALGLAAGLQGLQSGGIAGVASGIAGIGSAVAGSASLLTSLGASSGLIAGLGAAAPYLAVAAIAIPLIAKVLFPTHSEDYANITTDGVGGTGGVKNGGTSAAATTLAQSAYSNLQAFATSLGTTLTSGIKLEALGNYDSQYSTDSSVGVAGGRTLYATQDEAVSAFFNDAVAKGAISGISDTIKNLLTEGGTDLVTQENKAVTLKTALDAASAASNPLSTALKAINTQFTSLKAILDEGGASTEEYATIQKSYSDQIAAATTAASATLKAFSDNLKSGSTSPLSLRDQETASLATLTGFETDIAAGKQIDQQAFTANASSYLDIEKQINGTTDQFFSQYDRIQTDTTNAMATVTAAATAVASLDLSPVNANTENTANSAADIADNTANMAAGIAAMNAFLQSNGVNGFATSFNTRATV